MAAVFLREVQDTSFVYIYKKLRELSDKFFFDCIDEQFDKDSAWDDYVANWLSYGGEEYINLLALSMGKLR